MTGIRRAVIVTGGRDDDRERADRDRDRDDRRPPAQRAAQRRTRPAARPGRERRADHARRLRLAPGEALALAQQLIDAGRPFHAHEVLELIWKSAPAGRARPVAGARPDRRGPDPRQTRQRPRRGGAAQARRGAAGRSDGRRTAWSRRGRDTPGSARLADRIDRRAGVGTGAGPAAPADRPPGAADRVAGPTAISRPSSRRPPRRVITRPAAQGHWQRLVDARRGHAAGR